MKESPLVVGTLKVRDDDDELRWIILDLQHHETSNCAEAMPVRAKFEHLGVTHRKYLLATSEKLRLWMRQIVRVVNHDLNL